MGEFPSAMGHVERALASADVSTARERAAGYGIHTGQWTIVGCLAHAAWALWFLGAIDESLARSHEALTLAREFGQPLHLANARYWAAQLSQYRRDCVRTRELAEAVITASAKEGFAQQKAQGMFLRGWAMAEPGAGGKGWAQVREGFTAWEATGAGVLRPYYLALLAEVAAQAGDVAEGLRLVDEALATVERRHEPRPPVASSRPAPEGDRSPGTDLRLVRRQRRHRRPPGGQGALGGVGVTARP
jgi:hypothetical protein